MKKWLMCCMALLLMLNLAGCVKIARNKEDILPEQVDKNVVPEENDDNTQEEEETEEADTVIVDTKYFTLEISKTLADDCVYEVYESEDGLYSLGFYEKTSREEMDAGYLFSILLKPADEDYTFYPSYDVLGSFERVTNESYNVIVLYPTDVQFTEETAAKYSEVNKEVPNILDTISFKEGYTFSKNPSSMGTTGDTY